MNEVLCLVLKRVFRHSRPTQVVGAEHHSNRSYGMPSQHSQFMAFFAFYCLLFFIFRLKRKSIVFKSLLITIITVLSSLVIYSRFGLKYDFVFWFNTQFVSHLKNLFIISLLVSMFGRNRSRFYVCFDLVLNN